MNDDGRTEAELIAWGKRQAESLKRVIGGSIMHPASEVVLCQTIINELTDFMNESHMLNAIDEVFDD